PF
ncbi:putative membrane protein, partial [Chlamydia psittaci 03DC29]